MAASFIKTVSLLRIAIFALDRCWIFAAHNGRVARALKLASANIKVALIDQRVGLAAVLIFDCILGFFQLVVTAIKML